MDAFSKATLNISLIGFGEAGQAFAEGWKGRRDLCLGAFDIKSSTQSTAGEITSASSKRNVKWHSSLADALQHSDIVFSFVTADLAHQAACEAAPLLPTGAIFLDCNSCSPGTKKRSAKVVTNHGGHYIDVAVTAPVHPKLHNTPVLYSGENAGDLPALFEHLGMNATSVGLEIGHASSIKMMRSVMIKGMEALTAECVLAARRAGVEDHVLASLQASDPGINWTERFAYNLERMMVHGERRAAEMLEVAATLRELGLPDRMAFATAKWQDELALLNLEGGEAELANRTDRILKAMAK